MQAALMCVYFERRKYTDMCRLREGAYQLSTENNEPGYVIQDEEHDDDEFDV